MKIALRKQIRQGQTARAETIFGLRSLHPSWWGIGKEQLVEVVKLVRQAMDRGEIKNEHGDDPEHRFCYGPAVFNDRSAARPQATVTCNR